MFFFLSIYNGNRPRSKHTYERPMMIEYGDLTRESLTSNGSSLTLIPYFFEGIDAELHSASRLACLSYKNRIRADHRTYRPKYL